MKLKEIENATVATLKGIAKKHSLKVEGKTKAAFQSAVSLYYFPPEEEEKKKDEALADSKKAKASPHDACLHAMAALDAMASMKVPAVEVTRNKTSSVYWVKVVKGDLSAVESAILRNIGKATEQLEKGRICKSFTVAKSGYVCLHTKLA